MKIKYILVIILILAAFLRFYHLADRVPFEFDDQYNTYLVYNLVHNHKVSLVGQETSFGGMFLGPWHYLFLTPFYIATGLHPIGGFVGEGVIGLITIFSYYYVGSRLFSSKVGLVAAFIRAISINLIAHDLNIGPAYPSELVAVWFLYFLWKLLQGEKKSLIWLAFLGGMMFTIHLSVLPLLVVAVVAFLLYRPVRLDLKTIGLSLGAFLVPVSPIILFEIRHHFAHIIRFMSELSGSSEQKNYLIKFGLELNQISQMLYTIFDPIYLPWWVGFLMVGGIFGLALHQKKARLLILTFIVVIAYYLVYPRNVPNYYLMALIPVTLLYTSALLVCLWYSKYLRVFVLAFLGLIVVSNLQVYYGQVTSPSKFNLAQKDAAVKSIVDHQRGKGDFSISYFTAYGREFGFQYFFTLYGLEPRKEVKPPVYSLVMPKAQVAADDLSLEFSDIGVIFPEMEEQY